jgi:hypothetical protein
MNNIINDLDKFAMYSETYWDLDLPSKERSKAKRNIKNLVQAWGKKNIMFDCLSSILNGVYGTTYVGSHYVKLDATAFVLHYESSPDYIKEQAILVLKNLVSAEKSTGASSIATLQLHHFKVDFYNSITGKHCTYEK